MRKKRKYRKRKKSKIKFILLFLLFLFFTILFLRNRNNFINEIDLPEDFVNFFTPDKKTTDQNILYAKLEEEALENEKANWLLENFYNLSNQEQILIGNDPDTIDFIYNYQNDIRNFDYYLGESKDFGRATPFYLQWDDRWAYEQLGYGNIGFSGCGPTSLAMILARLEEDLSITPDLIAEDAKNYMDKDGISWQFFYDEVYKYNRTIDTVAINKDDMIEALNLGPLLVSVQRGYFTSSGHILVIDSYHNGKFVINDPNSIRNSQKSWTFSQIEDQIANIWLIY